MDMEVGCDSLTDSLQSWEQIDGECGVGCANTTRQAASMVLCLQEALVVVLLWIHCEWGLRPFRISP